MSRALLVMLAAAVLALAGDIAAAADTHATAVPPGSIAVAEQSTESGWIQIVSPAGVVGQDLAMPRAYEFGSEPAWSPDAGQIAFALLQNSPRNGFDVWVMDAQGQAPRRLAANGTAPAWSPDGASIAFDRGTGIWIMNSDGSAQRLLTRNGRTPAWSPDGRKIAFVRIKPHTNNSAELYVMNADGTNQQRLTNNHADDQNPDWSPDGTTIAFDRTVAPKDPNNDVHPHLFLMNPDGSGQRRLSPREGYDPAWSPDGAKLVYSVGTSSAVFTINADGSGAHKIYPNWPGACDCYGPNWSRR